MSYTMKNNYIVSFLLTLYFVYQPVTCQLPSCNKNERTYIFTECDDNNGRWSVEVPKDPGQCSISNPEPPVRGKGCDFSCDAGHYLDLASQTCLECPVGTYSLGSGMRFDYWDKLPEGFFTHAEAITVAEYGYKSKVNNCNASTWQLSKQFVRSNDDDCTSLLSYSVNLKQKGMLSFTYQYSDSNLIFHFYIQNSQCQKYQNHAANIYLSTTGTEWKTQKVDLNEGSYILNWKTTGILIGDQKSLSPVRIKDIEITGVSYTTSCHECRAGFHASKRASHYCNFCPTNTYSDNGAAKCESCDPVTEYAPLASEKCLQRPPCEEDDYFATHTACDENKMTSITYAWIEPKICRGDVDGSVPLPKSGKKKPCAPCNPGLYPTNSSCLPCPKNTYSDGTHDCVHCPASTSPQYGLFYLWWDQMPSNMKTSCISLSRDDCDQKKSWEAVGDKIQTVNRDSGEAYLVLAITPGGFMEQIDDGVFGSVTFAFQLDCTDDCLFYFMKDVDYGGTSVIDSWRGNQMKQTYTYDVTVNDTSISFTWAFQKGRYSDIARIFLLNISNVEGSSADSCVPCAAGHTKDSKCIPCPTGNFLNVTTHECMECPGNTKLDNDKTSCSVCGSGTNPTADHIRCTSDCSFISPATNKQYDFTDLASSKSVETLPTFTSTGRRYNHIYNISLCANKGFGAAECVDNVTYAHSGLFNQNSLVTLRGMTCRSTAVPMLGSHNEHITVHSQPTLIASTLVSVTQNETRNGTEQDRIFPKDSPFALEDVVFYMRSETKDSEDCPAGRNTYIHLRCSPDVSEESGRIEMQKSCPDGTCDGCNYNFLWRSFQACPICTDDDYKKVIGACEDGKMTTTYMWKQYPLACRDGVTLPESTIKQCLDYSFYIRIGVVGGIVILFIMCIMVARLWKKSKKLEYKYHRLIIDGKGNMSGGELPGADSCAISDSESDFEGQNDEVVFQKKKTRLIGKQKVNDYESVVLQPLTTGI